MLLANAALSALVNLIVFAGIPFFVYFVYHKLRYKRTLGEISRRAGLQLGAGRYVAYSALFALVGVVVIAIWPPTLEPFLRDGSPQQPFVGLGLSGQAVAMALLYGVVKTGFTEELLFRGLIAGSLSRRLPFLWANLIQAIIFFVPHLLVLIVMPEMWIILPVVFALALLLGWVRIKSGSIIGSWLVHAAGNVAICLSVAMQTAA